MFKNILKTILTDVPKKKSSVLLLKKKQTARPTSYVWEKTSLNFFSTFINEQNQLSSYQRRNKLLVQQVSYEKICSRNFFGRCFNNQNNQLSF